ncbi:MAG: restriction endonuclease subunit S [Ruminococcus sp.]|nr:restriction endonuclease subunit S [Ruminococcus sp.]
MNIKHKLGDYITTVDIRNKNLTVNRLLGVSINKTFIESIANTIGTDFSNYKIVRRGQFAYCPVTSRNGEKISVALLKEDDCIISSSYTVFEITDNKKLLPEYLMLWFMQPEFDRFARFKSHGSVREIFDWQQMCDVELFVPDIEKQKKIVDIYKIITDRIVLKNRINKNLEQQAQAVFKSWVVDFETNGTLSDICNYSKNKINIDNLTLNTYYSTENIKPNRQGVLQATKLPTVKQTTACKKGDVLVSNIRPYFKKILYCYSDCGCSTDVLCFVPNKIEFSAFLYFTLYADKFFDYMVTGAKGTKMPRGDKQQIMMYPIYIPLLTDVEKFNRIVIPILNLININRIENQRLSSLRDLLIPKLINGEKDVTKIQI